MNTTTIYLDPAMVPAQLRRGYNGKKFRAIVCESMTIPANHGLWSGGSRDVYRAVHLDTGMVVSVPNQNAAPWDSSRREIGVPLTPGITVVCHTIFCGQDHGLTFYLHPQNATALLPAPAELSEHEKAVLKATRSYKSSYNGRDRYQMACDNDYGKPPLMTRNEWNTAKQALIVRGYLNKAGAITNAGRNAIS